MKRRNNGTPAAQAQAMVSLRRLLLAMCIDAAFIRVRHSVTVRSRHRLGNKSVFRVSPWPESTVNHRIVIAAFDLRWTEGANGLIHSIGRNSNASGVLRFASVWIVETRLRLMLTRSGASVRSSRRSVTVRRRLCSHVWVIHYRSDSWGNIFVAIRSRECAKVQYSMECNFEIWALRIDIMVELLLGLPGGALVLLLGLPGIVSLCRIR